MHHGGETAGSIARCNHGMDSRRIGGAQTGPQVVGILHLIQDQQQRLFLNPVQEGGQGLIPLGALPLHRQHDALMRQAGHQTTHCVGFALMNRATHRLELLPYPTQPIVPTTPIHPGLEDSGRVVTKRCLYRVNAAQKGPLSHQLRRRLRERRPGF